MRTSLWDLRYAARLLAKNPGFAAIVIATLALGIGVNTAMFSVVDALIWKSLPLAEPESLVTVMERRVEQQDGWIPIAPANYLDWKASGAPLESLAAYDYSSANLSGTEGFPGDPERLRAVRVAPEFFETLRARPALGRSFVAGEDSPEHDRVVILSHRIWQRRFNSTPGIIGNEVQLDGRACAVIGVMPKGFEFPLNTDIWMPLAMSDGFARSRVAKALFAVGRLKPGTTGAQARASLDGVAERLEREFPRTNAGWRVAVIPMFDFLVGDSLTRYMAMLLSMAGCVLLIACANVASLQLARAGGRQREIAVRAALGACRWRLIRQLLTESALVSAIGLAAGLLLAVWCIDLVRSSLPAEVTGGLVNWNEIRLDGRALLFALGLTTLSAMLSGIAPSLRLARGARAEFTESSHRLTESLSRGRARHAVVAGQMALALVLLTGAGLLVKGMVRLLGRGAAMQPETLLTLRVDPPAARYRGPAKIRSFYEQLLARLEALPGVQSAGAATNLPHTGARGNYAPMFVDGRPPAGPGGQTVVVTQSVTPRYFKTVHVALRQGRGFDSGDSSESEPVVVVSEGAARHLWRGGNPVGSRVRVGMNPKAPLRTVVGVVADLEHQTFEQAPPLTLYFPAAQEPDRGMHLALRVTGDPAALVKAAQSEVRALDPGLPIYLAKTMQRLIRDEMSGFSLISTLTSAFGGLALALCAIGVYGVLACAVSERTREIGIRVALGAVRRDVLLMVLKRGAVITAAGMAAGWVAAFFLARALASLFAGVSPSDAATFTAAPLVLTVVAAAACWLPAWRATRVDPTVALRHE